MTLNTKIFGSIAASFLAACTTPTVELNITHDASTTGTVVADTITYLVYVRPQNPADDYEVAYLSHLQKDELVNQIFESVYQHGAKAHDFVTGEELSIDDIKTREIEDSNYSRDNVSAIQFTEEWVYDAKALLFQKKVLKIHIGYAVYDEDSIIVANRPSWVIDMK